MQSIARNASVVIGMILAAMLLSMFVAFGDAYAPRESWNPSAQNPPAQNPTDHEKEIREQQELNHVLSLINDLPDNAGLKEEKQVREALAAYNALSEELQAKITSEKKSKLACALDRVNNPSTFDKANSAIPFGGPLVGVIFVVWLMALYAQLFLSYGTAYRKTKAGGDNGIALFGWMLVYGLAAAIPGLGFYLWKKDRPSSIESKDKLPDQQSE